MFTFRGVSGTCIAQYGSLTDPKKFIISDGDLNDALMNHTYLFLHTNEEQEPLRKQLIKLGATSVKVGGDLYVHSIDTTTLRNNLHQRIFEAIREGDRLSAEEGRAAGEIRVGDRVVYNGGRLRDASGLSLAQNYWNDGEGLLVTKADIHYVREWGEYKNSNWYHNYFWRIPGKKETK